MLTGDGTWSWAIWRFSGLSTSDQFSKIRAALSSPQPSVIWIGISDYNAGYWRWQAINSPGSSAEVPIGAGVQSVNGGGNAYVALVVLGDDVATVNQVSLLLLRPGDPPVVSLAANPDTGNAPFSAPLTATASDPDGGGITKYEWDWDNDGVFDLDTGTTPTASSMGYINHGANTATVRVTDDEGATATASTAVTVSGWAHTWGFNGIERVLDMVLIGNILYEIGPTNVDGAGSPTGDDACLQAWDATTGQILWTHGWQLDSRFSGFHMAADPAGNLYILSGPIDASDDMSIVLVKVDGQGNLIWCKNWNTPENDIPDELVADDTGTYICGQVLNSPTESDALILHFDADGNLTLQKSWGGPQDEHGWAIQKTSDGFLLLGNTESYAVGNRGGDFLAKFDTNAQLQWDEVFDTSATEDTLNRLMLDTSGNIYLAGEEGGFTPEIGASLLKLDSGGSVQWAKLIGGNASGSHQFTNDLAIGPDDLLYHLSSYNVVRQFDLNGSYMRAVAWESIDTNFDYMSHILLGPAGKLYVGGTFSRALVDAHTASFGLAAPPVAPVITDLPWTPTDPQADEQVPSGVVTEVTPTFQVITGGVLDLGAGSSHASQDNLALCYDLGLTP